MNDGLRHSTIFTLGTYPQVIRILEGGAKVVQENCIRCHSHQISSISFYETKSKEFATGQCWNCHREVPHGRISSQASTPYARVPIDLKILPEWMSKELNLFNNKK
ncbi:MAG: hypothetical protein ACPLX7_04605 [Candidatus Kapaibacteriota bacterium]|jgi:cytochrome c nitrite reductase small subunit